MNSQTTLAATLAIGASVTMTDLACSCSSGAQQVAESTVGGYTAPQDPSQEELALFRHTYKGAISLTPMSVATQVVNGTNYSYVCQDKAGHKYRVVIHQELPCNGGEAKVMSVDKY